MGSAFLPERHLASWRAPRCHHRLASYYLCFALGLKHSHFAAVVRQARGWESGRRVSGCQGVRASATRARAFDGHGGMASPYWYVSRPAVGTASGQPRHWVAQKRDNPRLFRQGFKTAVAAARWIAAQLGVPFESLKRERCCRGRGRPKRVHRPMRSEYVGVVPHRGRWQARAKGGAVLATFGSQEEAAQRVARHRRVPMDSLRRQLSQRNARRLFRSAFVAFRDYVPGDIESAVAHEHASAAMYDQDGRGCKIQDSPSARNRA